MGTTTHGCRARSPGSATASSAGTSTPEDWRTERSSADIASHVTRELARDWDVPPTVLLHTWPTTTSAALATMLDSQRAAGSTWVGLDDVRTG